jgi:FK506-binding protein 4/5
VIRFCSQFHLDLILFPKLGDVIAGLEHGICTMKKGEKALFILPPLAYEDSGALGVPIGSELHFEVELLSWLTVVDVYKNGGIVKKVLSTGVNRQTGDLDEVTGEHSMTNNLAP